MHDLGVTAFAARPRTSGSPVALREMIDSMYSGSKISLLGIQPDSAQIPWSKVIFNALTLKGIYGREMWETWYKMEQMLISGLDLSPVIADGFKFGGFQKGFDVMKSGQCGKVLLEF